MSRWRTLVLTGCALLFEHSAAAGLRNLQTFKDWRADHEPQLQAFSAHLQAAGLAQVVPLHELLKSASAWQECKADPYAIPPREQWPAVLAVLRLLQELRAQGIVGSLQIHSTYRSPGLNACAGGAAASAHMRSFAIDFSPLDAADPSADTGTALCTFWREHGRRWAMGLSRYPSGRIHIDTAGYRTWGADHSGKSAFCKRQ